MEEEFYLITGVRASGKSTVAQMLASKLGKGVHLLEDGFCVVRSHEDGNKESLKLIPRLHGNDIKRILPLYH